MTNRRASDERLVRLAIVVAVCAMAIVSGWAVAGRLRSSRELLVREVRVEGNHYLSEADVRALAGFERPRSTVDLDRELVIARMQRSPWVVASDVQRPGRDIVVLSIVEAVPRVVVAAPHLLLVDATGRVIDRATERDRALPLLTGAARLVPQGVESDALDPESAELARSLGEPVTAENHAVVVDGGVVREAVSALDAWNALAPTPDAHVREIAWSAAEGLTLILVSGVELKLGDRDKEQRLRRARVALREASAASSHGVVQRIDVRGDRQAVVRFAAPLNASDEEVEAP